MTQSNLSLYLILVELTDGDSAYDIADNIGSQNDPTSLAIAEEIKELDENSSDVDLRNALDHLIDGDTVCDLSQRIFGDLSEKNIATAESYLDFYREQSSKLIDQ
jgi:hypothetical protein